MTAGVLSVRPQPRPVQLPPWSLGRYVSRSAAVTFTAPCPCGAVVAWVGERYDRVSVAAPVEHNCEEGQ